MELQTCGDGLDLPVQANPPSSHRGHRRRCHTQPPLLRENKRQNQMKSP